MKCTSCGKDFPKSKILYTIDRTPYCNQPFECRPEHPNSVENISERRGVVRLYTEAELEHNIFESLDVPEEVKNRIVKIATKPQSIRLSQAEVAYYILKLQAVEDLSSISEAVRRCIEIAMEVMPLPDDTPIENIKSKTRVKKKPESEPEIEIVPETKPEVVEPPKQETPVAVEAEEIEDEEDWTV